MSLPVPMDFEIRRSLARSAQCLEYAETRRYPCLPDAYRQVAVAITQMLTYGMRNTPEFIALVQSSPVLIEMVQNIAFEFELRNNRFPELAAVLDKARSTGPAAYPQALSALHNARKK
jgi:hypothetical protein